MTVIIILQMSAVTIMYALITMGLWHYWFRKEEHSTASKILVGLIYGACSVASTHFGIVKSDILVLNVRDLGPLAAGLFFSPLSGLLAGFIGGIERIVAGELWGIGRFTEIACGLSTCLAGILSAILSRTVYRNRRPPMMNAFFLGAVMEVFHMYAIFFTNRDSMNMAYYIVREIAVPMILFNAIGLSLCSMVIMRISKEPSDLGLNIPAEKVPVTVHFQRSLLIVTMALFFFNFVVSYNLQTRLANENVSLEMNYVAYEKAEIYQRNNSDIGALKKNLEENSDISDFLLLVTNTGEVVYTPSAVTESGTLSPEDMAMIMENMGKDVFEGKLDYFENTDLLIRVSPIGSDHYLLIMRSTYDLYFQRDSHVYENTLSDILLFAVFYMLTAMLMDRLVVRNLHRVNESLHRITGGDLNETVWVHTSAEFTALSEDINQTVAALRGYISAAEQRIREELKLAAAIQDSALPKNFHLPTANAELYALMTPAKQVGGDFYDFFYIMHNQLCLVVADVSGKGVPASLFMMRAKTAIKNYARNQIGPAEVLANVNHTLCEGNDAGMFVTVWLGILDLETGLMRCANAGHEYPVIMRAGGEYELLKDKHGLVLAAMDGIRIPEYEIQLNPGDRIFVYSDGVPEAINEKEEAYGTARLTARLNRVKNNSQEYILKDILTDIRNFAGSAEQFDDITMLGFTYLEKEN